MSFPCFEAWVCRARQRNVNLSLKGSACSDISCSAFLRNNAHIFCTAVLRTCCHYLIRVSGGYYLFSLRTCPFNRSCCCRTLFLSSTNRFWYFGHALSIAPSVPSSLVFSLGMYVLLRTDPWLRQRLPSRSCLFCFTFHSFTFDGFLSKHCTCCCSNLIQFIRHSRML